MVPFVRLIRNTRKANGAGFAWKRAGRFIVLWFLYGSVCLFAQTGYIPPNPVKPPVIQKITPPSVTPPSGPSSPVMNTDQPAQSAQSAHTAQPADTSSSKKSMSAMSLLGLNSDNALLNALSGSGTKDANVNALSSLLGLDTGTAGTAESQKNTLSSSDSKVLAQILELLEKQAVKPVDTSSTVSKKTGADILRFSVNGYSILGTVTTLVSSVPASDGTFLLTGDRSYVASGITFTETFYMLCRPGKNGEWKLTADVTQSPENTRSFLFELSSRSPVAGIQTGDLVVFRSEEVDWRLDLVIRAVQATVR